MRKKKTFGIAMLFSCLLALTLCVSGGLYGITAYAQSEEGQTEHVEVQPRKYQGTGEVNLGGGIPSGFSDFCYIPHWKYFWANPQHADNKTEDNSEGTCTTVAMQLLMGYHNYYSDRRLIPQSAPNGRVFLDANYGDFSSPPETAASPYSIFGNANFGTADDFFYEIFDLIGIGSFPGLGQAVGFVKDAGIRFVQQYAPASSGDVFLSSGPFDRAEAVADIDAGRPIILGMEPIGAGEFTFHVIVAYGYATYNGEFGFIVHNGYEGAETQIWYPARSFGFQIRMEVAHEHTIVDTGGNCFGSI